MVVALERELIGRGLGIKAHDGGADRVGADAVPPGQQHLGLDQRDPAVPKAFAAADAAHSVDDA